MRAAGRVSRRFTAREISCFLNAGVLPTVPRTAMRLPLFAIAAALGILCLPACSTVNGLSTVGDMVTANIPDYYTGAPSIVVELREQQAYLYQGGSLVASSRISTGREGYHTPIGHFSVMAKDQFHR